MCITEPEIPENVASLLNTICFCKHTSFFISSVSSYRTALHQGLRGCHLSTLPFPHVGKLLLAVPCVTGWHNNIQRIRKVVTHFPRALRRDISSSPFIRTGSPAHIMETKEMKIQVRGISSIRCSSMLSQQARHERERAVPKATNTWATEEWGRMGTQWAP